MRNFLNTNDIFPILEMIRREIRKNDFNKDRVYLDGDNAVPAGNPEDVVSLEVLRGANTYDPELIDAVIATYADGSVETTTLVRGVNPPVANTVPDYGFINNALISGFRVEVASAYGGRTITGQINRENGYGRVQSLNMSYSE